MSERGVGKHFASSYTNLPRCVFQLLFFLIPQRCGGGTFVTAVHNQQVTIEHTSPSCQEREKNACLDRGTCGGRRTTCSRRTNLEVPCKACLSLRGLCNAFRAVQQIADAVATKNATPLMFFFENEVPTT